ncbi:MAG: AAA family ATPase [Clostridia bacterium]|nr:AAA family ATPase [Clostridia bacterium]
MNKTPHKICAVFFVVTCFIHFAKMQNYARMLVVEILKNFLSLKSVKEFIETKQSASNAYLFFSPDSKTNKMYAKAISLALLCNNPICFSCPNCLKILGDVHPDVLSFPEGKSLSVNDSKNIVLECSKATMHADKKIIIINDIDNSSPEAQNKLLKIIEEPPKNVIFLATATNLDKVLPTIKSRMQKRFVEEFSTSQIEQMISQNQSPSKLLAISKGKGYIGLTLDILADENYYNLYQKAKACVFQLKSSPQILAFLGDKNFSRDTLSKMLYFMSEFYRDLMVVKYNKTNCLANDFELETYRSAVGEFSLLALKKIQENLHMANKKLMSNGNVGLIFETLLIKNLEVKFLCK